MFMTTNRQRTQLEARSSPAIRRPKWGEEIDEFEGVDPAAKRKIDEKVFAETATATRAYGQEATTTGNGTTGSQQTLPYPPLTKGPETFWDAPGMQRIKIPFGGVNPEQMMVLAELAEEHLDGSATSPPGRIFSSTSCTSTTSPDILRPLPSASTREACGNLSAM
jgi:sulfite reductase (ferredoxin)